MRFKGENSTKYGRYIKEHGEYIEKKYPNSNTKDIASVLGLDLKVLFAIIALMGLKKDRVNKDEIIKRYPYENSKKLAEDLGISYKSLRDTASRLGVKKINRRVQKKNREVIEREKKIIKRYPHENTLELARELYIDDQYLRNIASKLGVKKSKDYVKVRDRKIKEWDGSKSKKELAESLGISVSYLNKLIRKLKGKTP